MSVEHNNSRVCVGTDAACPEPGRRVGPVKRSLAVQRVRTGVTISARFARWADECVRPYILLLVLVAAVASAQTMSKGIMSPPANVRPPHLENVGIDQRLDAQVPPDLVFTDDTGRSVKLGDYFGKKPLILNLVYYQCTMLCGEALEGLTGAMKLMKFDLGKEFEVVTVSFNPQETPDLAAAKKKKFVERYGRAGADAGWHFLTGSADSINALTKAVGFRYQYDPKLNQYAHATAIMVLTPQGHISRYFYGVDFPPKDLRMGLVEASSGKIGNAVDQVLLYCYHYDPATGKYGAVVTNILRLGAGATIVFLGGLLLVLTRLDKAAQRRIASRTGQSQRRYV